MTVRYRQPNDVRHVEAEPETEDAWPGAYLALLPAGPIHWLDPTGYLIWASAVEGADTESVVREVASASGEPSARVRPDVTEFLEALKAMRLLVLETRPHPKTHEMDFE